MALKVKLVKSVAGSSVDQRATVTGLGLKKLGDERLLKDSPEIKGMLKKVRHLVASEVVAGEAPKRERRKPRAVRVREAARAKQAAK